LQRRLIRTETANFAFYAETSDYTGQTFQDRKLMSNSIWISATVLDWEFSILSDHFCPDGEWKKAYSYWSHAERTLSTASTEFHLIDVVTSLNRALKHRLKTLADLYSFKRIPIGDNPDKVLEQLEYFGIIRPLMLSLLIGVRNTVEHEYVSPPQSDRCGDFVEFIWYFLRSTDVLAGRIVDSLQIKFPGENDDYFCLELRTGPYNDWRYQIGGAIRSSLVSVEQKANHFHVTLTKQQTWLQEAEELRKHGIEPIHERELCRNLDDLRFVGNITGPGNLLRVITERFFSVL
jgi:hypothetical protein